MSDLEILMTFEVQQFEIGAHSVKPRSSDYIPLSEMIAFAPDRFGVRLPSVGSGARGAKGYVLEFGLQPNYDALVKAAPLGPLDRLAQSVTPLPSSGFHPPQGCWVAYDKRSQRPVAQSEDPGEAICLARAKGVRSIRVEYVRADSAASQIGL